MRLGPDSRTEVLYTQSSGSYITQLGLILFVIGERITLRLSKGVKQLDVLVLVLQF